MADALDSKSSTRKGVGVQVPALVLPGTLFCAGPESLPPRTGCVIQCSAAKHRDGTQQFESRLPRDRGQELVEQLCASFCDSLLGAEGPSARPGIRLRTHDDLQQSGVSTYWTMTPVHGLRDASE